VAPVGTGPSRQPARAGYATRPPDDLVTRTPLRAAIEDVGARDPVLARLVALAGPITHRPRDPDGPFGALVRAIVYQQLAGRAAHAIHGRVRAAVGDTLTPETLSAVPDDTLRAAGLSANKLASLRDLSAEILNGGIDLRRSSRLTDDELIAALATVRGIGRWTAEMYLIFELRRLDVWPVDDLGVRQGYGLAWNLDPPPSAKQLAPLGERFGPTARSSPATAGPPCPCSAAAAPTPLSVSGSRHFLATTSVVPDGYRWANMASSALPVRPSWGTVRLRRMSVHAMSERPRLSIARPW
jgi:DNA-3-methyladenine glycosylase II